MQHKAKVAGLQEQVKLLEETAAAGNADRSRTLKELAAERGMWTELAAEVVRSGAGCCWRE